MDHTTLHPSSIHLAHHVDLHLWRGPPQNTDETRPIEILVNHGYVVGFCPDRLQPAWSAYRVAHADDDVKYDRPLTYYDDMRLPEDLRIGRKTFGKIGGIQLNVGHMTPNEVINRQFGRLAQMETFLMSNMSPQYGSLNSGVWLQLETAIREIEDEPGKDHVWAIVGPVFGEEPSSINRGQGKYLPVPDAYFCVIVDPHSYPYDTMSRVHIDCFIIPQTAPRQAHPDDYPATLEEIEAATNLRFFVGWGREVALESAAAVTGAPPRSRLRTALAKVRVEAEAAEAIARQAAADKVGTTAAPGTIDGLIEELKAEAARHQILGRALTEGELAWMTTLQHSISYLIRARDLLTPPEPLPPPTLITYKIASDVGYKLQTGARTACNFWNRFVQPSQSIVIRLGVFTQNSPTIARAYQPYANDGTRYARVEFNTKYLSAFSDDEIAGTIIHEIGHSLGIGFDGWHTLYQPQDGLFTADAVAAVDALAQMEVERDGGPGTAFAHWDEQRFNRELMTGYQDQGEYVLPVTIDVMELLGHTVIERLGSQTPLADLLGDAARMVFSRQDEVERVDREYFEETGILETIPHVPPPEAG